MGIKLPIDQRESSLVNLCFRFYMAMLAWLQSRSEPVFCSWVQTCFYWRWWCLAVNRLHRAWEVFVTVSPLHQAALCLEPSQRIGWQYLFLYPGLHITSCGPTFFFFLSQRLKKEKAISHRPYKCLHHTKHPTCQSNFPKAFGASLALAHYIVRMAKHMCALFIMVASALSIPGTALAAVPF